MVIVVNALNAWLRGGLRAVHGIEPEFWRNLQREALAGRQWVDRAIVLAMAAATGAIVVGFTLLAEAASQGFRLVEQWGSHGRFLTLLWTPALTVALLWWTCRFVPGAMGSGITQVVRALEDDLQPSQRARLASLRVSLHKIGLATQGATAGAGYGTTRAVLEGQCELPGVYKVLKFCATWISAWSGVPAGVFAPSLAIGAGIGHDVALFMGMSNEAAIPLIAIGMAGFLAITTGGPITAFIIVMDMVAGQAMVLSLRLCALLSSGVAHLVTRPMYHELAAMLPLPPPREPGLERP